MTDYRKIEELARAAVINDDPEDWPLAGAVGWDDEVANELVAALTPGVVLGMIGRIRELEGGK